MLVELSRLSCRMDTDSNLHDGVVQDAPELAPDLFCSGFEVFPIIVAGGGNPLQLYRSLIPLELQGCN